MGQATAGWWGPCEDPLVVFWVVEVVTMVTVMVMVVMLMVLMTGTAVVAMRGTRQADIY